DPSGVVALVAVHPNEGWIGHRVGDFEAATRTRAAVLTRFGTGELPTPETLLQSGDTLHVLATDEQRSILHDLASRAPEGDVR
ncbi:MAG: TrkA C-terminal domain-containing protein, partial [Actinobacteria bacterium]|nr:TrkA C-terminal domain-containing protein [Actinomycetota bacterium]